MFDWRRNIFIGIFTGVIGGIISGFIVRYYNIWEFSKLLIWIASLTFVFTLICIIFYHIIFEKGINKFCNSLKENPLIWFLIFLEFVNLIILIFIFLILSFLQS